MAVNVQMRDWNTILLNKLFRRSMFAVAYVMHCKRTRPDRVSLTEVSDTVSRSMRLIEGMEEQ